MLLLVAHDLYKLLLLEREALRGLALRGQVVRRGSLRGWSLSRDFPRLAAVCSQARFPAGELTGLRSVLPLAVGVRLLGPARRVISPEG